VFVCPAPRQDGSRGACSDVFAQVAHSCVGGVRVRVRLFQLQHQPLHPDVLLGTDICESQHGDRGCAGVHDHGQWIGFHDWRADPVEWHRSDHHARQCQSADGAGSRHGPDHRGDRESVRADSRLGSVRNVQRQQHDDDRSVQYCPLHDQHCARAIAVDHFALCLHNFGGFHSVLQLPGFYADGERHEFHE
jgi:hypothetical protein